MIDPSKELCRPLSRAAEWVPDRGRGRCNASTMFRWAKRGCKGVVLETIQIGGSLCTSHDALIRFFNKLTRARAGRPDASVESSSGEPTARSLAAERELIGDGA